MAAAAALLRSVASKMKMSRAAPTHHHHHHPSLVVRGLHGGARSGSGSGSGPATYSAPPPPYLLLHGRGFHSRSSPVLRRAGDAAFYIAVFGVAIYLHCWYRDLLLCAAGRDDMTGKGLWFYWQVGGKEESVKMQSLENRVKELEANVMDLKAENAELKIALESGRSSQGKV